MYVQLFVFTFLTSVTSRTFHFIERALPRKSLTRHFYRLGESKRPWIRKHIPSHAATAKREAFFFSSQYLTIFPQHTSTETHSLTPARTQFVVIKQLWQYIRFLLIVVFSIVWSCMNILIQLFCFFACYCSWTWELYYSNWGGLMGVLLLKPHIWGHMVLCWSVLTSLFC